jgi:hypothetical protein
MNAESPKVPRNVTHDVLANRLLVTRYDWKFYGRRKQLVDLERMLARKRWFFAKVTGRRRIGKTTLIQQAMRELGNEQPVLYVQIPGSEPAGVLSAINDALDTFQVPSERHPRPNNLLQLAKVLEAMAEAGYILILDEFQYFNRKGSEDFCSYMQASVDRLAAKADQVTGGLMVLGSIHTEMVALLEDRTAPLYNRVTDDIGLTHLDIGSIRSILRDHSGSTPERLLFLWNLFEGVPPQAYSLAYREQQAAGASGRSDPENDNLVMIAYRFHTRKPPAADQNSLILRSLGGFLSALISAMILRSSSRCGRSILASLC